MTSEANDIATAEPRAGEATPEAGPSPTLPDVLPELTVPLTRAAVLERLGFASRRGKLAGYRQVESGFVVDAFGAPFDADLIGRVDETGGQSKISFMLKRRWKMPLLYVIAMVLMVEPGRYFTDQLIPGEWGWIDTRWWYYPLTILPLPWLWLKCSRASTKATREHAAEQIEKIRGFLESAPA